jgi:predicted AlkP superfamily pyrophosphatase or phosphodiesterase
MIRHPRYLLALALAALSACSDAAAPTGETAPALRASRVVLVSVDGLRADALSHMPQLRSLAATGTWTDAMRTVLPSLTVPGHLSMLSGRDVTTFGINTNSLDSTAAIRFVFGGATTVFEWVRAAGMHADAVAGASLVAPELVSSAQSFFSVDTMVATDLDANAVTTSALARLADGTPPDLLFVHYPDADVAGHDHGWIVPGVPAANGGDSLGTQYIAAVARIDAAIATLHAALAAEIAAGHTALIVTADHGGGHGEGCSELPSYREHCSSATADITVPFILVARDAPALQLTTVPTVQQVAPTIAAMLGVAKPRAATEGMRLR